jgi:hypothetical protein
MADSNLAHMHGLAYGSKPMDETDVYLTTRATRSVRTLELIRAVEVSQIALGMRAQRKRLQELLRANAGDHDIQAQLMPHYATACDMLLRLAQVPTAPKGALPGMKTTKPLMDLPVP